jgi:GNAT superfamily N-acetyltransferase
VAILARVEIVVDIRIEGYASGTAQLLIAEALADLAERYGDGDSTPVHPAEFEAPNGAFLVAYLDGEPVGCGAWRTNAQDPTAAEIKRVFVRRSARQRGVARALLAALESSAREAGRVRAILETGTGQPEAIALYEKAGYLRIPDFGHYKGESGVRSFGRDL